MFAGRKGTDLVQSHGLGSTKLAQTRRAGAPCVGGRVEVEKIGPMRWKTLHHWRRVANFRFIQATDAHGDLVS